VDVQDLLLTSARAAAVYVLMLLVIRALGKRTVGNFSAFDLLIALMLGDLVDEIVYGDVRFLTGAVAIVTLAGLAALDAYASYANARVRALLEGKPTVVLRNGELIHDGMRAERLSEQDVMAMLRLQGVQDVREVRLATVEADGELSVLKQEWAEPTTRADVDPSQADRRAAVAALPAMPTDSPRALGEA
jgi:uncharacterized membrane protein YcaP (DUF421 family)